MEILLKSSMANNIELVTTKLEKGRRVIAIYLSQ
jgi:hypothetical protein